MLVFFVSVRYIIIEKQMPTQRSHRVVIILQQIAVAVVAAVVLWTIAFMIFEEKFIFFPSKYPEGLYGDAKFIPNLLDCRIPTEDGLNIHAWFAPADSARAMLVMFHGNAGNISHRIEIIRRLQRIGFNVLMFDYHGYGKSEGSPSEAGVYKDGRAAFDYVLTLRGVDSSKIFLWGTSLGGAVAVDVPLYRKVAGLILESTFSSAVDVAATAYRWMPVQFVIKSKFNSIEKIPNIHIPLFQMHGNRDRIIGIALGKKLFDAANEPKEFYTIEGADHNDTFFVGGEEYLHRVKAFVEKTLAVRK